jgi:hypothetical protein
MTPITLDLTQAELGLIWAALRFKPFQGAIQEPQTKRATRDLYRTLTDKLREAKGGKPDAETSNIRGGAEDFHS